MADHERFRSDNARPPLAVERAQLIGALERETPVTLRVLRAFPAEESEFKPHPRSMSARALCWLFTMEMRIALRALLGADELYDGAEPPDTLEEVGDAFETARDELLTFLQSCPEEDLAGTVKFPVEPGKLGDWPRTDFLWLMLHDQIHHRGQLSVYLRLAGGKVPSIYGPSADEPWF